MKITSTLNKIAAQQALTEFEAIDVFEAIMTGQVSNEEMAAFLMGLRTRGETVEELLGAVTIMRQKSNKVKAPEDAIDIVGTGGDDIGTVNISTLTSLIVAGAGATVAKHGSKAFSSSSGAGDVLASLGVNMDAPIKVVEKAICEAKVGFMLAPLYHPAMRYVQPIRQQLGLRTIFNFCGPMTNPASVKRLLVGSFDKKWLVPMANILKHFGAEHAWIVRGNDGIDELTLTTTSHIVELKNGEINEFTFDPKDYGFDYVDISALLGGGPEHNAKIIRHILEGKQKDAVYDVALLNAGAALYIAGKAQDIALGIKMAEQSVEKGKALEALESLIKITKEDE